VEVDAERTAHEAVRAIASNEIVSLDAFAPALFNTEYFCTHTAVGFLESFEFGPIVQAHMWKRACEVLQNWVEPDLRAHLRPHRAMGPGRLARARRSGHAAKLVARKGRYKSHVERIVRRERAGVHGLGNSPAPTELHRADIHFVHLRGDDRAVALFDECAGNPAPAELARKSQAHRSASDDQNGSFLHARAPL